MRQPWLLAALAFMGCDDAAGCCGTGEPTYELVGLCDGTMQVGTTTLVSPSTDGWSVAVVDRVEVTDLDHHASDFLAFDLKTRDEGYPLTAARAGSGHLWVHDADGWVGYQVTVGAAPVAKAEWCSTWPFALHVDEQR